MGAAQRRAGCQREAFRGSVRRIFAKARGDHVAREWIRNQLRWGGPLPTLPGFVAFPVLVGLSEILFALVLAVAVYAKAVFWSLGRESYCVLGD